MLMYILYPQNQLLVLRYSSQTFERLPVSKVPYPCILLDRSKKIPLDEIPVIAQGNCPEGVMLMPLPAEGRPDKVFPITHSEDKFYLRVEQIEGINKIYIQV